MAGVWNAHLICISSKSLLQLEVGLRGVRRFKRAEKVFGLPQMVVSLDEAALLVGNQSDKDPGQLPQDRKSWVGTAVDGPNTLSIQITLKSADTLQVSVDSKPTLALGTPDTASQTPAMHLSGEMSRISSTTGT